ncbi:hypothetical protein Aci011_115 [Acinetobacter phage vB_AbaM_B09_Aci01-1]|uniref:Uncharacterized protein n=2 Tax=Saclayvirus TaxID=2733128 RepID=A0A386KLK9_9CAUD|nr:hypothetical protein HOU29_gp066 [Acinetobacter phage vB_AbaM_B09_Aci01-1]YP_009813338.1 hypothetical protein HOU30_gp074 [Acinetobacter phage vB_AbaM_B09_Aci02-2]AYD85667.1 hypothetical protein Aci011_115 [Acinetobacter phage vB_AbaM_B09_Aci01-1]AYD85829.1 hypothetical protein Aci022_116 [Acinetobacter phage vB_AbaM_B09_Aci02-2]
MKIVRNGITWDSEVHKNLIKKLGGVKSIESRLKEPLMSGEIKYYETALFIKDAFEAHNVEFKQ